MSTLINTIVADNTLHAKWLNTLSLMENTGARKISAGEHPLNVTLIVLKHAAEEARHAFYLKKQISKVATGFDTYQFPFLLAPLHSYQYLHALDIATSRYLKTKLGLSGDALRYGAYLLVTYAIEVRADELYPVYQEVLESTDSKVNVKSIILEEAGHLEEMIKQLQQFSPDWELHAAEILRIEKSCFEKWTAALEEACQA
ncbi:MAG: hypothetical protein EOO02_20600 [Chitinophagaceae bacterium]|nr:MAG: hypothetical protein EOO02_20600 [Chitinophagaceae bacterium]